MLHTPARMWAAGQDGTWDMPWAPWLFRLLLFPASKQGSKQASKQGSTAAVSVLSSSCPEPAQCPHGVPGDGAVLWSASCACNSPVSLRLVHAQTLGWHPEEALGEEWASSVAQGFAGAGCQVPMPLGRVQLWQAQGGIWETLATSWRCPFRQAQSHRAAGADLHRGWEGRTSQPQ